MPWCLAGSTADMSAWAQVHPHPTPLQKCGSLGGMREGVGGSNGGMVLVNHNI